LAIRLGRKLESERGASRNFFRCHCRPACWRKLLQEGGKLEDGPRNWSLASVYAGGAATPHRATTIAKQLT